ncbi:MFS-type transporter SLC18B1-like isoform X1 [Branchiostoma floridae]|uniref:MFS-type transporter SLC18B1-like isoform X1 n=1 Tax=Branchiostoma floridae TaxID=7739 RepID=A0A9J7HQC4_BRAFL|nr:MFS-type transporter SLC18B1-like isoform X1 [Branchiostoma floridae]
MDRTSTNTEEERERLITYEGPSYESVVRFNANLDSVHVQVPEVQERPLADAPTSRKPGSHRRKLTLVALATMNLAACMCYAIPAPFFPGEAQSRGVSDTAVGLVFGTYAFFCMVTGPLYGKYINLIGVKFMLIAGMFVAGTCSVLFGMLDYMEGTVFLAFCFVIRAMEAVGVSACYTASFAIMAKEFPDNVATVLGTLEIFTGAGMMIGPPVGGALYSLGGYKVPFLVVGGFMLVCAVFMPLILPRQSDSDLATEETASLLALLKVPSTYIASLAIMTCAAVYAFLEPTLQPYLDLKFDMTEAQVGLIFLLSVGLYTLSAPLWGWLTDRGMFPRLTMVLGLLFTSASYLLIGPSPLLEGVFVTGNELWMVLVGLGLSGISLGAALVPTFSELLNSAREAGLEEDSLATYGLVSGVYNCMYSLGEFIGPTIGGFLDDQYQFPIASTATAGFGGIVVIGMSFFYLYENRSREKSPSPCNGTGSNCQLQHFLTGEQDPAFV